MNAIKHVIDTKTINLYLGNSPNLRYELYGGVNVWAWRCMKLVRYSRGSRIKLRKWITWSS